MPISKLFKDFKQIVTCDFFYILGPLRLQKRAAFYIANETACVVDNTVYNSGDPIPTDDPCEACRCRPPGFACVLKECESKPGCRAVRRVGQCCPEYICDSDNSTNVDYAFSTEKAYSNEETTVNPKTSESTLYSEIPENIANAQETKENDKDSPDVSPPESLDPSLLFSVNEETESSKDVQTTKKDTSTESISDLGSEETSLDAESSEENSPEKQIENVTELLKTDYEIINDEEKPKEPETTPEQGPSEVGVGSETSAVTDKNVEIFPVEESTTVEVKFKTAPPAEVTGQTTVSSTTVLPDSFEDADDKANELIKRFRSLKNLTSDDATESPKENVDVKSDDANDASTKETTEKVVTPAVTEKPTTVKLEKEIVVEDAKEDVKSSEATTEAVSKSETLHYNSDAKVASESVETVTTVVEVKEPTSSEKVEAETSSPAVSNDPEQVVFKALSDEAEANNEQETTVKPIEATTSQATVEISDSATPKVADVSASSSLPPETDKSGEKVKLYADDSKIVPSTEAPKVTEIESNTTVVTEVSSEKVEPSKE
ncbi:hypothetical protein AVEN_247906-2 [Araneus ventricosus]|uniref:VWFC domain-containing protein n=1 Tax=Araneus ventricosus TaxID=182803 RepID=A0A4Y2PZ09_ARAVE|nr:hypothetical protein AVEN_247906-2 [Araneus ventricosus]